MQAFSLCRFFKEGVMLLIELGGIDNTEVEIERTLAVLAQAIKNAYIDTAI